MQSNLLTDSKALLPVHLCLGVLAASSMIGAVQECEELMDKGISGSGTGFDAPAAGKLGGRWHNPSEAELRDAMRKVSHYLVEILVES